MKPYTIDLQPAKIEGLIPLLSPLWSGIQSELIAFADFLAELAEATQEEE